ncbi:hypothetical protein Patl1_24003 [Pistacia atlantica]|uniref:Uncharacterized protein n=1 Tax=Pistacia atlantica TaxID=434234 RepID=A0ACC0ZV82_9ROSI|nr:hypothetical protein Patl1_24003 [Pistacia atlantica]
MVKTEQKIQQEPISKAMPSTSSSSKKKKYKEMRMRSWGSWVSEIRSPPNQKTRIWLGSYSTPEATARADDAALLCLNGSSANLNFPITSSYYILDLTTFNVTVRNWLVCYRFYLQVDQLQTVILKVVREYCEI